MFTTHRSIVDPTENSKDKQSRTGSDIARVIVEISKVNRHCTGNNVSTTLYVQIWGTVLLAAHVNLFF